MSDLFRKPEGVVTRWTSFENPEGAKGRGAMENQGAKGHAFEPLRMGEEKVLLDVQGCGTIHRFWMTLRFLKPSQLRSTRLRMYWDKAQKPAVDVPLGDFTCNIVGHMAPLENALFANAEGRSMVCTIPMPFRTAARITVTNEGDEDISHIFYDVNYTLTDEQPKDALYFHAAWRRENPTTLGEDFEILPRVEGAGRFLGAHVGVLLDPVYTGWFGEGEVKMYLDGDGEHPTLAGTGLEDYVGTAWGLGEYQLTNSGTILMDREKGRVGFYRYHIPDPVYFDKDCRVTIQQIGGTGQQAVVDMMEQGLAIKPVSIDAGVGNFVKLLETNQKLTDPGVPEGWTNHFREDDWCAIALFYLDRPENNLPLLAPVEERVTGMLPAFEIPKR